MNARSERPWKLFSEDGCGKLLEAVLGVSKQIAVEYPSEEKIISAIQQGFICFSLTEKEREKINEIIDTLSSRKGDVILQYFGIDQERKTLKEIAENYNLSKGRIHQIKEGAIRSLRHPSRVRIFREIISLVKFQGEIDELEEELNEKSKELDKCREAAIILAPLVPKAGEKEEEEREEEQKEKKIPIEEIEWPTVRISNVLRREKIKTLGDLCAYTPKRLLRCRNFGQKSLQEVTQVLAEYGLSLARIS